MKVTCDAEGAPPDPAAAQLQARDNQTLGCRLEPLTGAGAASAGLYRLSVEVGGRGYAYSQAAFHIHHAKLNSIKPSIVA